MVVQQLWIVAVVNVDIHFLSPPPPSIYVVDYG